MTRWSSVVAQALFSAAVSSGCALVDSFQEPEVKDAGFSPADAEVMPRCGLAHARWGTTTLPSLWSRPTPLRPRAARRCRGTTDDRTPVADLRFSWMPIQAEDVDIVGADQPEASFVAPFRTGDLTFELGVTDGAGQTGTGEVTVSVTCTDDEAALCRRDGRACGPYVVEDRCGVERTILSCGLCIAPEVCEDGACVCSKDDRAICAREGYDCGTPLAEDDCGIPTPVNCGECEPGLSCGGAGQDYVCGGVVQLAMGQDHTYALVSDGTVRCWGLGANGRLGYGNFETIGDDETPSDLTLPVDVGGPVTQIAAGSRHT